MDVLQRTKLLPSCKLHHVDDSHSCLLHAFRVHQNILAKDICPVNMRAAAILIKDFTDVFNGDTSKLQKLDLFSSLC
jgi:hypothetical protein